MNNQHIVTRDFRGIRLYLQDFARSTSAWRWVSDQRKAQRMTLAAALDASERASREWGAHCAVMDAQGTLAQSAVQEGMRMLLSACMQPNGKVDCKAFLTEMETRNGGKLKPSTYRLLAKVVTAFEIERKAARETS